MALALVILFASIIIMTLIIIWGVRRHRKDIDSSQVQLTDRALLLLINAEPDRIVNAEILAKKSGISLNQARTRLFRLMYAGIVQQMSSGFKSFYELKSPIEKENLIDLSDNPFISIEDLFTLFEHFGNKMNLQDICMATGLPFKVIKEEMKYFQKEGVVHEMTQQGGNGFQSIKFYTLQDGYKVRGGDAYSRNNEMNLDLEKIYNKVSRDEDGFV